MLRSLFFVLLFSATFSSASRAGNTYVGADEADNLFAQITAQDMDRIRELNILIASRSYGQNMLDGITRLTNQNSMYALDYQRNIINRWNQPHTDMPTDIFAQHDVNHYLVPLDNHLDPTYRGSFLARVDDLDDYLRDPPYQFGGQVDVVMLEYHESDPLIYDDYNAAMSAWRADFPEVTFIYVTSGVAPEAHTSDYNETSWAFGTEVLDDHLGVDPIMDWRDLLSTDAEGNRDCGHNMCPEFNIVGSDNNNPLHPNMPFIEERLGRAFLVLLQQEFAVTSADFDSDDDIDGADFLAWQRGFGMTTGATLGDGDANGDGAVNSDDLGAWESQYGTPSSTASSASIPEPSAILLCLLACLMAVPCLIPRAVSPQH